MWYHLTPEHPISQRNPISWTAPLSPPPHSAAPTTPLSAAGSPALDTCPDPPPHGLRSLGLSLSRRPQGWKRVSSPDRTPPSSFCMESGRPRQPPSSFLGSAAGAFPRFRCADVPRGPPSSGSGGAFSHGPRGHLHAHRPRVRTALPSLAHSWPPCRVLKPSKCSRTSANEPCGRVAKACALSGSTHALRPPSIPKAPEKVLEPRGAPPRATPGRPRWV